MIKTCCLLCFICFTLICRAQANHSYYGVVLTQISNNHTGVDTSRLLYCRNIADDRLSVYVVRGGVVAEATAYQLGQAKNGLFCYSKSLLPGEETNDTLGIAFQDKTHTVVINSTDRYILFPAYYARFKREVKVRHSIMALLNLLSDAIGDYPIANVLPLLSFTPVLDQQIYKARVVTQRSQADMKDTWTCNYYYTRRHQLDVVSASSADEVRFHKKVHYSGSNATSVSTFLNIESRQTTNRSVIYNKANRSFLKWKEQVYETGKNRETFTSVNITRHDLGMLQKIEPTIAEVLKMLTPAKTHEYSKKHIN